MQLMIEAVAPTYGWDNVFFSTTELLVSLIKQTFPELPTSNIVTEPVQRDVGPAVGLAMVKLQKLGAGAEPVTVLWSDSYPAKTENFKSVLNIAENKLKENPNQLVWLAQVPSFANENLGWIKLGDKIGSEAGVNYYRKAGFQYRPELAKAEEWFKTGSHIWNTGYFSTTPDFMLSMYEKHNPEVFDLLKRIQAKLDTDQESEVLNQLYPQMPSVHFDNIVLDNIKEDETLILEGDFEWNDPGTLYALKQFLQTSNEANVTKGAVKTFDTTDSLVFNYVDGQAVTAVGLEGFVIVNTKDAVLVCHKNDIGKIKEMLKTFPGTEFEKLL